MSTATLSAAEITGRASSLVETLRDAYRETQRLKRDNSEKTAGLERLVGEKLAELATIYLPDLAPETVGAVLPLTGFRAFSVKSPADELRTRRDALSLRVAAIEQDPRYVDREKLTHPVVGELTLELRQAEEQKRLIDESVSRYESQEGFLDLIERGYDTPDYGQSRFSLKYLLDWKRGDEIEDGFKNHGEGGEETRPEFSDLAHQYRQVKQAQSTYQDDIDRLGREIAAVGALVTEREQALTSLDTLATDVLAAARKRLVEHLEHADRADLALRAKQRPDLLDALKHVEGLEKKVEYLEALERQYIDPDAQALLARIAGLEKKAAKYRRPKNRGARVPAAEAERWFKDPTPKLRQRWGRYDTARTTVYQFNRYDDYDFFSNYLWWDVMTDGRLDGDFIPEVSDYRASNPDPATHYHFTEPARGEEDALPALSEVDFS